MSQQEGESPDLPTQDTRASIPEFLTNRLSWLGLGALTSVVVASMAFTQGAWNGEETADRRAPAVEPDRANEDSPSLSSTLKVPGAIAPRAVSDAPSGSPKTRAPGKPKADRAPAPRPLDAKDVSAASTPKQPKQQKQRESDSTNRNSSSSSRDAQQAATSYLWADGSVDSGEDNGYWDQSIVTVKSTTPLTKLKVVASISQTGGVFSTGVWTSLGDKVTVTSSADSTRLTYVITLKQGVTLDPGTYVFKLQYNHNKGNRDSSRDRYNVSATSTRSVSETRTGGF
jgi:hypothetical protein